MNPASAQSREFSTLLARIFLGLLFVYLGTAKVIDPVGFLKLVRQFDLLPQPLLLNAVAGLLPWFEVFCGVLLLAGIRPRGAALVAGLMLFAFTALLAGRAWAIFQAGQIPFCAIRFDCGCGTGEVLICAKLIENTAALLLATVVALRHGRRFCLWPSAG
jgi:uncharacterized membrane protein YphA (DoxX/SURF4 family)